MKVLLVTSGFPSVGRPYFGKKRLELAERLIGRGHEMSVVTVDCVDRIRHETYKGISVTRIPKIYNPPFVYYPIPNIPLLRKTLDSVGKPFDILHFYKQQYLISFSAYFNGNNKPKVLTIDTFPGLDYRHGSFLWDFAGFMYGMTLAKLLLRKFDRFISMSKVCVRTAIRLGVKKNRIEWIPHGIDTGEVKPDLKTQETVRQKMRLKGPIFSFVGRLSSVKGIVYLVRAVRQLDRGGVEGNLLIIGDGPQRKELSILKKNKNINFLFLGFRKNAVDFIQASDFIVLPSLGEGCPNVILEAFASGKPVIASSVGGVPDLVQHMETGILVDAKNVRQLAQGIRTLVADPHQAQIMGRNARKFAERELDWDVLLDRNEKVYWSAPN